MHSHRTFCEETAREFVPTIRGRKTEEEVARGPSCLLPLQSPAGGRSLSLLTWSCYEARTLIRLQSAEHAQAISNPNNPVSLTFEVLNDHALTLLAPWTCIEAQVSTRRACHPPLENTREEAMRMWLYGILYPVVISSRACNFSAARGRLCSVMALEGSSEGSLRVLECTAGSCYSNFSVTSSHPCMDDAHAGYHKAQGT